MKQIIGLVILLALMGIDFALVQELLLRSNSAPLVAILGAALFCAGLDGGPAFLGMGIAEFRDATREKTGTGKLKSEVFMIIGSVSTLLAFVVYFIIRRDSIVEKGGFKVPHYDGFNGDLVLLIVPFLTSFIAFGIGWWMFSHGADIARKKCIRAQEEYNNALDAITKKQNELSDVLTTYWEGRFPETAMPASVSDAITKIRGDILAELEDRLKILLPQIVTDANLLSPFINSYIDIYRNHVLDPEYLSAVNITMFEDDHEISRALSTLRKSITDSNEKIIKHISKN